MTSCNLSLSPLGDNIKDIGSAYYYYNYNYDYYYYYYYWAKIMSVTQAIQHHSFFNIYNTLCFT